MQVHVFHHIFSVSQLASAAVRKCQTSKPSLSHFYNGTILDKSSIFLATFKDELKNSQLYFWKNIPNQFLVAASDSAERYGIYSRMRPQVIAFLFSGAKSLPTHHGTKSFLMLHNRVDKILSKILGVQNLGVKISVTKFLQQSLVDKILATKSRQQNLGNKISATKSLQQNLGEKPCRQKDLGIKILATKSWQNCVNVSQKRSIINFNVSSKSN